MLAPKTPSRLILHKHLSVAPSNNKHSTPPSNCYQAVGAPCLPVQPGRTVGHSLETGSRRGLMPRIRLNRRARRAVGDQLTVTQSSKEGQLAGVRVGESHMPSRVWWAGALEAPSHGRSGAVPCISVLVETVAARRAAREQKPPIKWTSP